MSMNESDEAKRARLANRPLKPADSVARRADGSEGERTQQDVTEDFKRDQRTRE
jgi:hypothetical protein